MKISTNANITHRDAQKLLFLIFWVLLAVTAQAAGLREILIVASVERNLPTKPEFHRPANSGHFSFLFPCSNEVAKVAPFLCTDPPGIDRADFHRKLNAQVLAFFRKNLNPPSGEYDSRR